MKSFLKHICVYMVLLLISTSSQALPMDINFRDVLKVAGKTPAECANRLSIFYSDGHGYVDFACRNCNEGAAFQEIYSLYPQGANEDTHQKSGSKEFLMYTLHDKAIPQLIGGLFLLAIKQVGIESSYNEIGKISTHSNGLTSVRGGQEISAHVLSDVQARAIWIKLQELLVKSKAGELIYNPINYNCMDFPQTIYEAAGLPGNYLRNSEQELKLFWEDGQPSPACIYTYLQYGDIRKLMEQIYSQVVLGQAVKAAEQMCQNVVSQECLQTDDNIATYEKNVAAAYQVYLKKTYIGCKESGFDISLWHPLTKFGEGQVLQGFKNIGLTTEESKIFLRREGGSSCTCQLQSGVQTYWLGDCSAIQEVTVHVDTDKDAQIHWVEVTISPKKSNDELEKSLQGVELISPKGNRLLYTGMLEVKNLPKAIADSHVGREFKIKSLNYYEGDGLIIGSGEKVCLGYPQGGVVLVELNEKYITSLDLKEVGVQKSRQTEMEFEGKHYPFEISYSLNERNGHLELDATILFK